MKRSPVTATTPRGRAPAQPVLTVVGRVVSFEGSATVIRNGVSVSLHVGDGILKGDVLQTGTGKMSVTFNDGSTLELTANSRLAVNDFVYAANGGNNNEILDLVRGSLTFVSGEVAHSGGHMDIKTPVATMGIRGTVGTVSSEDDGTVHFSIIESATGAVLMDSQGNIFANITANGPDIIVHFVNAQLISQEEQKSPQEILDHQAMLEHILQQQNVGQQILLQFFNQQVNPQSTEPKHTQIEIDITKTILADNNTPAPGGNPGTTFLDVKFTLPPTGPGDQTQFIEYQFPQPQNNTPTPPSARRCIGAANAVRQPSGEMPRIGIPAKVTNHPRRCRHRQGPNDQDVPNALLTPARLRSQSIR